jgi:hypothetical protein
MSALAAALVESGHRRRPASEFEAIHDANIVLNELDGELARRGLRFVRYADDCNIFVWSERAGQRVMTSIRALGSPHQGPKIDE